MSDQNLTAQTIRFLLDRDFRDAWTALAKVPEETASGRGNFMFGREAMALLELACRVCHEDPSGKALADLSAALEQIETRYFTPLPAPAYWPKDFDLPSSPTKGPREQQLMCVIYDLVRHGQAHQRQQIMVTTTDNNTFGVSLTGAMYGRTLETRLAHGRPPEHLSLLPGQDGEVFIVLCPEVLFLDLQAALDSSGVFHRWLGFKHLARGQAGKPQYAYTAAAVEQALKAGGHATYTPPAADLTPPPENEASTHAQVIARAIVAISSLPRTALAGARRLVGR
jgi:hypothetical protein